MTIHLHKRLIDKDLRIRYMMVAFTTPVTPSSNMLIRIGPHKDGGYQLQRLQSAWWAVQSRMHDYSVDALVEDLRVERMEFATLEHEQFGWEVDTRPTTPELYALADDPLPLQEPADPLAGVRDWLFQMMPRLFDTSDTRFQGMAQQASKHLRTLEFMLVHRTGPYQRGR